jgi:hypothetical protein
MLQIARRKNLRLITMVDTLIMLLLLFIIILSYFKFSVLQFTKDLMFIVHDADRHTFLVLIGDIDVCASRNIEMAFGLYFAFNLWFTENSMKMLVFLQKYAFHIDDFAQDPYVNRVQSSATALMKTRLVLKSNGTKRSKAVVTNPSSLDMDVMSDSTTPPVAASMSSVAATCSAVVTASVANCPTVQNNHFSPNSAEVITPSENDSTPLSCLLGVAISDHTVVTDSAVANEFTVSDAVNSAPTLESNSFTGAIMNPRYTWRVYCK